MLDVGEQDTLVSDKYHHHHHKSCLQRFKFPIIAAVVLVIALAIVFAVVFSARMKTSNKAWNEQINVNNIMGHLQQLQNIADANNGTRASTTSGYNASVAYIVSQLHEHTNYEVTVQEFNYTTVQVIDASNLTVLNPSTTLELSYRADYNLVGSGPAGTYNINNVTVILANGYGCDPSDYAAVTPGSVALVSRGNCTFDEKIAAAETNNPAAVIIFNEGNTADRIPNFRASASNVKELVLTTGYYAGVAMKVPGTTISITITTQQQTAYTMNVIADTKVGNAESVIVVGSHLDSVPEGPGINDNGSGSSLNIELAITLASSQNQKRIKNKIRFCWFAAEELGLLGSHFYVNHLNATNVTALREIAVNLNFDMIGSPNFIRGVYNGSSDSNTGSHTVQNLFNKYYASQSIAVTPTPFSGRSDYGPFLAAGIPAGGLFTGAEEVKTMSQRTTFGGLAGAWLDPCYHQACDTIENIDKGVVGDMARGAAYVLEQMAIQANLPTFLQTVATF